MTVLAETAKPAPAIVIALSGALSLAIAMGIGRFAFTPMLPMMLHENLVDIKAGSLLATANYIGYLAGALLCMALPSTLRRLGYADVNSASMVRMGLAATALLTAAMAINMPLLWPFLRFLSGVISAVAFVYTSGWCLGRLAELGHGSLSGVIYTGPGVGIALSGLTALAISGAGGTSSVAWLGFGVIAAALTTAIWSIFHGGTVSTRKDPMLQPVAANADDGWNLEQGLFTLAYGLAGFGYIITATFLPVIARQALPGSVWIDLFWPLLGVAVAVGALLTRTIPLTVDRRILLVASYLIQAAGILATLLLPNIAGFICGSVLVGLPFTTITLFGLQEARRLKPLHATTFIGALTAAYGLGQIVGPLMVALILDHARTQAEGFHISLAIAMASLVAGALTFLVLRKRYPQL